MLARHLPGNHAVPDKLVECIACFCKVRFRQLGASLSSHFCTVLQTMVVSRATPRLSTLAMCLGMVLNNHRPIGRVLQNHGTLAGPRAAEPHVPHPPVDNLQVR